MTRDGYARPGDEAVALPRALARRLASAGGEYRVLIAWPAEPPPPAGYPVLYLLDAGASFGTLVESLRMRARRPDATGVGPAVVAGVAHPADAPYDPARRTADFTPSGAGAAAFLDALTGRIRDAVETTVPVDAGRRSLVGHSLGGLFVLHALATVPQAFRTYVALSPSIWQDRERLLAALDARGRAPDRPLADRRLMLAVGEYEQTLAPWQAGQAGAAAIAARRDERRMVDEARDLARRLDGVVGDVRFELYPGEDHASVVPLGLSRCLRLCAPA